jgi:hypothetical protein
MADAEKGERLFDPTSVRESDFEPILGDAPALITHLDTYPIRRVTVKVKKIKNLGTKEVTRATFKFKINPPCSTVDETPRQSSRPRRSSFVGTEEDFMQAYNWAETMLKRGTPNDTSIDLGRVRSRLSLIKEAFEKAHAKNRTVRISPKPAV